MTSIEEFSRRLDGLASDFEVSVPSGPNVLVYRIDRGETPGPHSGDCELGEAGLCVAKNPAVCDAYTWDRMGKGWLNAISAESTGFRLDRNALYDAMERPEDVRLCSSRGLANAVAAIVDDWASAVCASVCSLDPYDETSICKMGHGGTEHEKSRGLPPVSAFPFELWKASWLAGGAVKVKHGSWTVTNSKRI